jgi:hypothetical protein
MVFAWQELPSARPGAPSADVCDGREAFAPCTSERHRTGWPRADRTSVSGVWFACIPTVRRLHVMASYVAFWPEADLPTLPPDVCFRG